MSRIDTTGKFQIWCGLLTLAVMCLAGCTSKAPKKQIEAKVATAKKASTKKAKPLFTDKDWALVKAGKLVYPVGIKGAPESVSVTRDFFMKKTEVTQKQWHALMGSRPAQFKKCPTCPVERVSWFDAVKYANRLSAAESKTACYSAQGIATFTPIYTCPGYRLPTEAEWMIAASRYGQTSIGDAQGVLAENSGQKTHSVGSKAATTDGVFDLYGNVWEWCHDYYGEWTSGRSVDPVGPATAKMRVARGGSWRSPGKDLTPFSPRYSHLPANKAPTRGFRLVRTQTSTQ